MRLKQLLGVTLDELRDLLTAEEARAAVRAQLRREDVHPERRRELLEEALGHIDRQLELVEHRAAELAKLRAELSATRRRVRRKLREQAAEGGTAPSARADERSSRGESAPSALAAKPRPNISAIAARVE
jgi:DNA-binding transcriptional MerR regulator